VQLARELVAAALNLTSGTGARFPRFDECDAICRDSHASKWDLARCTAYADGFNHSGDSCDDDDDDENADPVHCTVACKNTCDVFRSYNCLGH
jgi:hypothetical protein